MTPSMSNTTAATMRRDPRIERRMPAKPGMLRRPCRDDPTRRSGAARRRAAGRARRRRPERVALPHHVRRHAGADDRGPVALALADRVAAVGVEAVTEGARALVHEEAVLALPAGAVGRVERVDVEVAPERVERVAAGRRPEAVHGSALVEERPEEVVVLAVGPVGVDRELGQRPGPVREPELPDGLLRRSARRRSSGASAATTGAPSWMPSFAVQLVTRQASGGPV